MDSAEPILAADAKEGLQTAATLTLHVAPVPGVHRITFAGGHGVGTTSVSIPFSGTQALEVTVSDQ